MEYVNVTSSNIASVAYDESSNTLGVRFLNGLEYHYFGVQRSVYEGLRSAGSVGRYFDEHVKKAGYSYKRVG